MWRSRARSWLLLRIPIPSHSAIQSRVLPQTLTLDPIPHKPAFPSFNPLRNPRLFATSPSSIDSGEQDDYEVEKNVAFDGKVGGVGEKDGAPDEKLADASLGIVGKGEEGEGDSLSSLWEESVGVDEISGVFGSEGGVESVEDDGAAEAREVDEEQVESVRSLLESTLEKPLESSLAEMELSLSAEFVEAVIRAQTIPGENLIGFYRWALKNCRYVKTSKLLELLVFAFGQKEKVHKKEAYQLWDLIRDAVDDKGLVSTVVLNQLLSMFSDLGKGKAGLEVFDKFDDFGCLPNADSYYYTIEALGKRSIFDAAWSVCEKMMTSGSFPDREKTGKILALLCRGYMAKEAHLVYLMAKEKEIGLQKFRLAPVIRGLSKKDDTVRVAFELLEEYSGKALQYASKSFCYVVKGLCRIGDIQEAKKLVLRMAESGPPPGNAVFNYVITALSKAGELEEAVALMEVMESRGLRPDVYTYTVVMSGYAKGGMMDEAYKILCLARKMHGKLCPATYHVLTRGYCKMEEFHRAIQCLKEMKSDGVQPSTDEYKKMIQSLCLKALDWHAAEELLEEMKESGVHIPGITQSLVIAVKEMEKEEVQ